MTGTGRAKAVAAELRALADRMPADGSSPASLARQRAVGATEAVAAALTTDPTLAEHQQRWLDVLAELLRRLTGLARQAEVAAESERLSAAGASTAHLGRINPLAAEELDAVSARCAELAAQVAAEARPDWDTPRRWRELSASRMPDEHELAEVGGRPSTAESGSGLVSGRLVAEDTVDDFGVLGRPGF